MELVGVGLQLGWYRAIPSNPYTKPVVPALRQKPGDQKFKVTDLLHTVGVPERREKGRFPRAEHISLVYLPTSFFFPSCPPLPLPFSFLPSLPPLSPFCLWLLSSSLETH